MHIYKTQMTAATKQVFNDTERIVSANGGCRCSRLHVAVSWSRSGLSPDLVVLGRDPFHEDPSKLIDIPIERTMTGGKWVYES
jgi:hypothetical protein